MDNQYWAAKDEIGKEILDKVQGYKEYCQQSGIISDLRKSFSTYYYRPHIQDISQSLKAIHVNHYANLINHVLTMVTSLRPAWETRAINSDLASQNNAQLASGLLDFYMREKGIEKKLKKACEMALFLKEGWVSLNWNPTSGNVYGKDENDQPIYEGDLEIETHNLLDVVRDVRRRDMNHQWYILRRFQNKYDLAAKYPDKADKILAVKSDSKYDLEYELNVSNNALKAKDTDCELIPVYTLYHDKSPAMEQGRMTTVIDADDVILFDGPLPYSKTYLFPLIDSDHLENAFGHSKLMDCLPVQDALNLCVSSILTNVAANGVQNFQVPKGSAPKVTQLKDGMNVLEFDPKAGPMQPLELLKTAPEVYTFADYLLNQLDLLSGVPPISKGVAPATMSGTAMALLQQQALQSASGIQLHYTILLENIGTAIVELLQTYAVVPRIAVIAGKNKKNMMKTFTSEDLKGVNRVMIDTANPLTKTSAGRIEIANNLLAAQGMISTPEQYIGVLTTGNLEPLYQHDNSNRMLMAEENEELMQGKQVQVLLTDDDALHILEHQCVLASPEARANPEIVNAVIMHLQQHIDNGRMKDPALAMALKQTPIQQLAQPMAPQGMSGQPIPAPQSDMNVPLPEPAQPPMITA